MIVAEERSAQMFCDVEGCPASLQTIGVDRFEASDRVTEVAMAAGWIIGDLVQTCPDHDEAVDPGHPRSPTAL